MGFFLSDLPALFAFHDIPSQNIKMIRGKWEYWLECFCQRNKGIFCTDNSMAYDCQMEWIFQEPIQAVDDTQYELQVTKSWDSIASDLNSGTNLSTKSTMLKYRYMQGRSVWKKRHIQLRSSYLCWSLFLHSAPVYGELEQNGIRAGGQIRKFISQFCQPFLPTDLTIGLCRCQPISLSVIGHFRSTARARWSDGNSQLQSISG